MLKSQSLRSLKIKNRADDPSVLKGRFNLDRSGIAIDPSQATLNEIPGVAAIVTQDGYQVNPLWPLHHTIA
jgi:hypothetical protein